MSAGSLWVLEFSLETVETQSRTECVPGPRDRGNYAASGEHILCTWFFHSDRYLLSVREHPKVTSINLDRALPQGYRPVTVSLNLLCAPTCAYNDAE